MPALRRHRWTAEGVRRLVDERAGMSPRYELVDGDLLVTAPGNRHQRIIAGDRNFRPLLVCEVLSQGTSRHDRITKRRAFQRNGVPEYWVIDGDAEAIEVWHPNEERAALIDERVLWQPHGATSAFELDIRALFAAVADDAPLQ